MECTSYPGENRNLLVIVVVGALFVLEKSSTYQLLDDHPVETTTFILAFYASDDS